jgi:cell division protein ZapA (FtsZ GTPase activity inhibitor)
MTSTTLLPEKVEVKAKIGSHEYSLRVPSTSHADVQSAVDLVHKRFEATKALGKTQNPERIAVMVALNLAVELNTLKTSIAPPEVQDFPDTDIRSMREQIGAILGKQQAA